MLLIFDKKTMIIILKKKSEIKKLKIIRLKKRTLIIKINV